VKKKKTSILALCSLLCAAVLALSTAEAQRRSRSGSGSGDTQRILGPGLYVFQTRLDHSSCGESQGSGSVTSYFAAVDGFPGSRQMTMHLLNSDYWSTWTLAVTEDGRIIGDSQQDRVQGPARGDSHFELHRDGRKFTGRGSRGYTATIDGHPQRCRMAYDALLRRLHE
jgi:hypothetical protein